MNAVAEKGQLLARQIGDVIELRWRSAAPEQVQHGTTMIVNDDEEFGRPPCNSQYRCTSAVQVQSLLRKCSQI